MICGCDVEFLQVKPHLDRNYRPSELHVGKADEEVGSDNQGPDHHLDEAFAESFKEL